MISRRQLTYWIARGYLRPARRGPRLVWSRAEAAVARAHTALGVRAHELGPGITLTIREVP